MRHAFATVADRLRGDAVIVAFAGVGFLLTLAYGAYLAPEWDPVRDDQQEYLALARGIVAACACSGLENSSAGATPQ